MTDHQIEQYIRSYYNLDKSVEFYWFPSHRDNIIIKFQNDKYAYFIKLPKNKQNQLSLDLS
jgi:hypothetical protein